MVSLKTFLCVKTQDVQYFLQLQITCEIQGHSYNTHPNWDYDLSKLKKRGPHLSTEDSHAIGNKCHRIKAFSRVLSQMSWARLCPHLVRSIVCSKKRGLLREKKYRFNTIIYKVLKDWMVCKTLFRYLYKKKRSYVFSHLSSRKTHWQTG